MTFRGVWVLGPWSSSTLPGRHGMGIDGGVLANSVSQRTRDFGMRQALGTRFGQLIEPVLAGSLGL